MAIMKVIEVLQILIKVGKMPQKKA